MVFHDLMPNQCIYYIFFVYFGNSTTQENIGIIYQTFQIPRSVYFSNTKFELPLENIICGLWKYHLKQCCNNKLLSIIDKREHQVYNKHKFKNQNIENCKITGKEYLYDKSFMVNTLQNLFLFFLKIE